MLLDVVDEEPPEKGALFFFVIPSNQYSIPAPKTVIRDRTKDFREH